MDSDNFKEYSSDVMPVAGDSSPGYSAWDDVESPKQISAAKENGSDFIIVYMHYGNEYSRSPNQMQEKISHKAIDAGADTVVG
ncbi:CapA family protein, partial [uncultured Methanosphaera sp.]